MFASRIDGVLNRPGASLTPAATTALGDCLDCLFNKEVFATTHEDVSTIVMVLLRTVIQVRTIILLFIYFFAVKAEHDFINVLAKDLSDLKCVYCFVLENNDEFIFSSVWPTEIKMIGMLQQW